MSGLALSMALDGGQAVSQYTDWPFAGFFVLDGDRYAAGPTGIYKLGGKANDGEAIACQLRLPATDGGRPGETRLECVTLGGRLPDGLTVRAAYDGQPKGEYAVRGDRDGQHTVYAGRGCFGRFLELELAADGQDFSITSIVAECQELGRRSGRR
jgi:hypothetical protein